jgi:hypothetical protein
MTKLDMKSRANLEQVKKLLAEDHSCYVLLTCTPPTTEGKMEVEMAYEGEDFLASYLIDNAQSFFASKLDQAIE